MYFVTHSSLQNNLERSEFEARTRLGSQVETLQREVNLLKRKLESEEKHHKSIIETWEVRITHFYSTFHSKANDCQNLPFQWEHV